MQLHISSVTSLRQVDPILWNALAGDDPFLCHEFLLALEHSGCVGEGTSWHPHHLTVCDAGGRLLGALPLYIKYDSRGEFVFDWGWADAYQRSGRRYYPKLVSAVPFTPATGRRLLVAVDAGASADAIRHRLIHGALELAVEIDASSCHLLFPLDTEAQWLAEHGFLSRKDCQFHWHNRGYRTFDDFLATFSSAKRKKARRERRRIAETGVRFDHLSGDQPDPAEWDAIFAFHARTFLRRGRDPYLNRAFFEEIAHTMPQNIVILLARYHKRPIAAAICFRNHDSLFGRYWGSLADFHSLHFETCYYQGIDYCIREGIERFEPGTQGEHKVSRGFTPVATWSSHWLRDSDFRQAVADFLRHETAHVDAYISDVSDHVPYRRDIPDTGTPRV